MDTTTPQEAQAQLTEARMRTQGISGFSPVWVAYEIILIAMTFGVLCAYFDGHPDFQSLRTPFFAMGMAWLFGGIVMLILTKTISKPIRFGFGRRWDIMHYLMAGGFFASTLIVVFAPLELWHVLAIISTYMLLGIAAPVWEVITVRNFYRNAQ